MVPEESIDARNGSIPQDELLPDIRDCKPKRILGRSWLFAGHGLTTSIDGGHITLHTLEPRF
jgi:hypothetical protein